MPQYDEAQRIEMLIRKHLRQVYTALPGFITAVKPEDMKAKVKITRTTAYDEPLETGWLDIKTLYAGEGHGFCLVPYVGDECTVLFQDKNLNDGFVLPMSFNNVDKPPLGHVPLRIGDCLLRHKTGAMFLMDKDGNIELWESSGNNTVMFKKHIRHQTTEGHEVAMQNNRFLNDDKKKEEKSWVEVTHDNKHLVIQKRKVVKYLMGGNPYFCPYDVEQEAKSLGIDLTVPYDSVRDLQEKIELVKAGVEPANKPQSQEDDEKVKIAGADSFDKEEEQRAVFDDMHKYIHEFSNGIILDLNTDQTTATGADKQNHQESLKVIYNSQLQQLTKIKTQVMPNESSVILRAYCKNSDGVMCMAGFDIICDANGPRIDQIIRADTEGLEFQKEVKRLEDEIGEKWEEEKE